MQTENLRNNNHNIVILSTTHITLQCQMSGVKIVGGARQRCHVLIDGDLN